MIFVCDCGKRFTAPEGTPTSGHACPSCGGTLKAAGTPPAALDLKIMVEQKKALRDELRLRDRQLRIALAEIKKLKEQVEKLQGELARSRGPSSFVTISEAPVVVDRSPAWQPLELPTERLDIGSLPLLEEIAGPADAPQLPSDRVPLLHPTEE